MAVLNIAQEWRLTDAQLAVLLTEADLGTLHEVNQNVICLWREANGLV